MINHAIYRIQIEELSDITGITVGDIDSAVDRGAEEYTDNRLAGVLGNTVVVVDIAEEDKRMDDHLLERRR